MANNNGWLIEREDDRSSSQSSSRARFIQRTYMHLAGAILAFIAIEAVIFNFLDPRPIVATLFSGGRFGWLIVLGAFMGVGMLAEMWARSRTSQAVQYLGLTLYVIAEAIIFVPLLYIAQMLSNDGTLITQAGILTGMVFLGLTATVFITRKDFSFLAPILTIGFLIALGVIICACIFGFTLGLLFSFVMVVLLSGSILFQTSNLRLHYDEDQHVAAALGLFASVATLFWYILQILMSFQSRN